MAKKIHMGKKLAVRFEKAGSKLERREVMADAEDDIVSEGSRVQINQRKESLIDVRVLPSLHGIMENALAVVDSEIRHHLRVSQSGTGLDRAQVHSFGQMTRSLAQIVGMENDLRDQSELDAMSDEDLIKLAEMTSSRLLEKDTADGED